MSRLLAFVSLLFDAVLCSAILAANTQPSLHSVSKTALAFTKNMGQWDDRVLFRASSGGATMWFTREGVTCQFIRTISRRGAVPAPGVGANSFAHSPEERSIFPPSAGRSNEFDPARSEPDSIDQLILTAKFLGANPNPEIIAEGQMEYKCNYFLGNDRSKWHTDVPNYETIPLKDIYPGIDLKYSGDGNGQAAYEFIAAPGADIAQIKVEYEGAKRTSLDNEGNLILHTKWGNMTAAMKSPTNGALSGSCAWWTSSSTTSRPDLAHGDVRQAQNSELSAGSMTGGQSLTQATSGVYSTYLGGGSATGESASRLIAAATPT